MSRQQASDAEIDDLTASAAPVCPSSSFARKSANDALRNEALFRQPHDAQYL